MLAPRMDLLDPADVARLGGIEIVAQGVVEGFLAGFHRSPFRGFSVEFTEHRAYQPGDELRYLDWKILARSDRLFVKQFEEETNLRAMILVDASRSMAWRGAEDRLTKRAYADRLVAALALILLRQRDATGLVTFDDRVRQVIPARVRTGQWTRLVRGLLDTPDGHGTAAEGALRHVTSLLARRGLVVLISDLLLDRDLALTALRYLRHRGHHVIVFHIMDRAELDLTGPPEVRFRDSESAASVLASWLARTRPPCGERSPRGGAPAADTASGTTTCPPTCLSAWRCACSRDLPPSAGPARARRRGDPGAAASVRAPRAARGRIPRAALPERGRAPERPSHEAPSSAAVAAADHAHRAGGAGGGTAPGACPQRRRARAHRARRRARQFAVLRRGRGRATAGRAPAGRRARVARGRRGGRSVVAPAGGRRGAPGDAPRPPRHGGQCDRVSTAARSQRGGRAGRPGRERRAPSRPGSRRGERPASERARRGHGHAAARRPGPRAGSACRPAPEPRRRGGATGGQRRGGERGRDGERGANRRYRAIARARCRSRPGGPGVGRVGALAAVGPGVVGGRSRRGSRRAAQ